MTFAPNAHSQTPTAAITAISAPPSPNLHHSSLERPDTPHPGLLQQDGARNNEEQDMELGKQLAALAITESNSEDETPASPIHHPYAFSKEIAATGPVGPLPPICIPGPPGYRVGVPYHRYGHWFVTMRQLTNTFESIHHLVYLNGYWFVGGTADIFETANLAGGWIYPYPMGNNMNLYHSGYPRADVLRFGPIPPTLHDLTLLVYALELERNMFRRWVWEAECEIRLLQGYDPARCFIPDVFFADIGNLSRFVRNISKCLDPFVETELPGWASAQQYKLFNAVICGERYPARTPWVHAYGPVTPGV
ncbi:hypothetical protein BD410DRAFT_845956 [Rickenella mellea]|uniref:Uncharacterized protein n=1 Tax=Rickenella mellea TaxID=50990 RepID=A0A4Y7PHN0_9AGAM|nr:hypothetical protein BD410DRAFT_845956 [Rickenella mellea]